MGSLLTPIQKNDTMCLCQREIYGKIFQRWYKFQTLPSTPTRSHTYTIMENVVKSTQTSSLFLLIRQWITLISTCWMGCPRFTGLVLILIINWGTQQMGILPETIHLVHAIQDRTRSLKTFLLYTILWIHLGLERSTWIVNCNHFSTTWFTLVR